MKVTIKTAHGYLSAQPPTPGGVARWQYRDEAGEWERFELEGFEFPEPPPPPDPPEMWPPAPGTTPPRPPDVATVNLAQVQTHVRYDLWVTKSNDDETYWLRVIVLDPEPGHTPGWTGDSYWSGKIAAGDGVGKGYVWPPR